MDKEGTTRIGTSYLDPYLHSYLGIQISKPLFINIRRNAETSSLFKSAKRIDTAVDLKFKLFNETQHTPEIALGLQSALGKKRQSGEFLSASKRYNNFDFTAGIGWGRYGTAGHIDNPLKIISKSFGKDRNLQSNRNSTPENWFSGEKIGLFGGIEYFLPVKGLSLKLDYGTDRYTAEKKESQTFNAPSPWGIGLSYTPVKWMNAGFGIQGKDKITARLNIKANPKNWGYHQNKQANNEDTTKNTVLNLDKIYTQENTIHITSSLPNNISSPLHIRNLIKHVEKTYKEEIKETKQYAITLKNSKIRGKTLYIPRQDHSIPSKSTEEIWNILEYDKKNNKITNKARFLAQKGLKTRQIFSLELENQISPTEEQTEILYRSSILASVSDLPFLNTINGATIRLNIAGNNEEIDQFIPANTSPVRSDISNFSSEAIGLENAYIGLTHNIAQQLYFLALAGYIEELYAGIGGEILYRPYSSRIALGVEAWRTSKRKSDTFLNTGLTSNLSTTAFANLWYDIPKYDITANIRAGRYLAGDAGVIMGLQKNFKNGAAIEAKIALSNAREVNIFGDDLTTFHSINFTLPFHTIPHINASTQITTKIQPFARDIAQTLNPPINLYDKTTPLTINHLAKSWNKIPD